MKIEILGMGCMKCQRLADNVRRAIETLGLEGEVIKVQDVDKIAEYGVMMTPALVIDGVIKSEGWVLSVLDVQETIKIMKG